MNHSHETSLYQTSLSKITIENPYQTSWSNILTKHPYKISSSSNLTKQSHQTPLSKLLIRQQISTYIACRLISQSKFTAMFLNRMMGTRAFRILDTWCTRGVSCRREATMDSVDWANKRLLPNVSVSIRKSDDLPFCVVWKRKLSLWSM